MSKAKNQIGILFDNAPTLSKQFFRAEIARLERAHGVKIMQKFHQTGQYQPAIVLVPSGIVDAARQYLGYEKLSNETEQ